MNQHQSIQYRTVVVGLVRNHKSELLLCKMNPDRGVFPSQWGFPGGGIEPGERMVEALRRELREELGIEVEQIKPAFFKDGFHEKLLPNGQKQNVYMIFLIFNCATHSTTIQLNHEFSDYRWVKPEDLMELDLNVETIDTLEIMGEKPWVD